MPLTPELLAQWEHYQRYVVFVATVAFSLTGVLAVSKERGTDLPGILVFGVITGVGGGTLRDVILNIPPSWSRDQAPIWIAAAAAVVGFYWRRRMSGRRIQSALEYMDGLGVAMFSVQTTGEVWIRGFARPAGPILLGVLTAIGGGLVRDVLAGRRTLLMRPELYATPVLFGCIASTLVLWLAPEAWRGASLLCIAGTFAFRAAAIHWRLQVPEWARVREDPD